MNTIKSKRISSGLYEVTFANRVFHVENEYQARGDGAGSRNDWNLYELNSRKHGDRDYCQSFCAKWAAMEAIESAARGEW